MSDVLSNIRIVLVGTLYSGNVGAVCRAMANMGITDLVLAAPKICDAWDEATRMAVHADHILNARRETATLADALEKAGCTDTCLLEHLRAPGPHVRGCFALDAVLGKE